MARHTNLDAMIPRADFAVLPKDTPQTLNTFEKISLSMIAGDSNMLMKFLRKPDFQRETVQWTPQQVASLVESFLDNELIPAVILWQSPSNLFVIDGGHRLSALLAWANDDYGDGDISLRFFKGHIPSDQKRTAATARREVERRVGRYAAYAAAAASSDSSASSLPSHRQLAFAIRGLQVQWISGDADKAESSFFKINTQGAPLDEVEEKILRNRRKAPAIAARSVVRASTGHKYWSNFGETVQTEIQNLSQKLHFLLFSPEIKSPIKTLDLPLGGSASTTQALNLLMSLAEIATLRSTRIENLTDDPDGEETVKLLKKLEKIAQRIIGNNGASLGLHPFVWFYTSQGRHYEPLFLAIFAIIAKQILANNDQWFKDFTMSRGVVEEILIRHKTIVTLLISALGSKGRITGAQTAVEFIMSEAASGKSDIDLDALAGKLNLTTRLYTIQSKPGIDFSDEAKSSSFLKAALATALKCPICQGYLDPAKSVSYDHKTRKQDGGDGAVENCQLTHPYCNTAIKN